MMPPGSFIVRICLQSVPSRPDDKFLQRQEPVSVLFTSSGPGVHHKTVTQKIFVEELSE